MISANLTHLRKYYKYSQEYLARKDRRIQAGRCEMGKGETMPDLENCIALCQLCTTSHWMIGQLLIPKQPRIPIAPQRKTRPGTVTVGDRGQTVIPKKRRYLRYQNRGQSHGSRR